MCFLARVALCHHRSRQNRPKVAVVVAADDHLGALVLGALVAAVSVVTHCSWVRSFRQVGSVPSLVCVRLAWPRSVVLVLGCWCLMRR